MVGHLFITCKVLGSIPGMREGRRKGSRKGRNTGQSHGRVEEWDRGGRGARGKIKREINWFIFTVELRTQVSVIWV